MAIIVDKEKKRTDIAVACTELLLEKGLKNLTVTEIAKTAGIGKGTVYDYFANKEAVVYEIIRNLIKNQHKELNERSNLNTPTIQKVLFLFDFFLCENTDYSKHLEVYREYTVATLSTMCQDMCAFNGECSDFMKNILTDIINEGISKGELIPESVDYIDALMATERGFLMMNWTENKKTEQQFKDYITNLFNLLENKK